MQKHLSDEQLTQGLLNLEDDAAARVHLAACAPCREETERLRQWIAQYQETLQTEAKRPASFWHQQHRTLAARWAKKPGRPLGWAVAVAVIILAALLLIEQAPPAQPVADWDPDHVLLVEVERAARRDLPRALEPAALLAQEISREASHHPSP